MNYLLYSFYPINIGDSDGEDEMSEGDENSPPKTPVLPSNNNNNNSSETSSPSIKKPPVPKVTYEDVMNAKQNELPLTRLVLNRYVVRCSMAADGSSVSMDNDLPNFLHMTC